MHVFYNIFMYLSFILKRYIYYLLLISIVPPPPFFIVTYCTKKYYSRRSTILDIIVPTLWPPSIPLFVTIQGTDLLCTTMLPSIFVIFLIRVFWEFTYFKVHIWTQILDLFISSLIAFKEKLNYFQLFSVINENYNPLSMENGLVTAYSIPNEF